jgi:hypothetical protein
LFENNYLTVPDQGAAFVCQDLPPELQNFLKAHRLNESAFDG